MQNKVFSQCFTITYSTVQNITTVLLLYMIKFPQWHTVPYMLVTQGLTELRQAEGMGQGQCWHTGLYWTLINSHIQWLLCPFLKYQTYLNCFWVLHCTHITCQHYYTCLSCTGQTTVHSLYYTIPNYHNNYWAGQEKLIKQSRLLSWKRSTDKAHTHTQNSNRNT